MKRKLGTKLLAGGLLVVVIPLIVIGIASVYKATDSISSIANEEMLNVSKVLADTIDLGLSEELRLAQAISLSNSVVAAAEKVAEAGREASGSEIALAQRELGKIREAAGDRYDTIVLFGRDGLVFADGVKGRDVGINASDREYYRKALQGQCNLGDVVKSKATGNLVCMAACPIFSGKNQRIIGVSSCTRSVAKSPADAWCCSLAPVTRKYAIDGSAAPTGRLPRTIRDAGTSAVMLALDARY